MYAPTLALATFNGASTRTVDFLILRELLDAWTRVQEIELRADPSVPLLYESGVRYEEPQPNAPDDPWQDVFITYARRLGDCEDLACWRAAELRVRFGIAATVIFTVEDLPPGDDGRPRQRFHILVRYPDGTIEDPSRRLGMR